MFGYLEDVPDHGFLVLLLSRTLVKASVRVFLSRLTSPRAAALPPDRHAADGEQGGGEAGGGPECGFDLGLRNADLTMMPGFSRLCHFASSPPPKEILAIWTG